ncbi:hypothetical protein KKC45_04120 [Patescibacteria group bacterium]|nr:hypothetical protein [Patescibacteria group bacterium]
MEFFWKKVCLISALMLLVFLSLFLTKETGIMEFGFNSMMILFGAYFFLSVSIISALLVLFYRRERSLEISNRGREIC